MSSWRPIIGLEVHVELNTKTKMFCSCLADHFGQKPNVHTCPVCLGLPGTLPVINYSAVEKTILIALCFGAKINKNSWFDRKNYFYPDLPKGYQISQHFQPFGRGGEVPILVGSEFKKIQLDNIHLEEDTGKLVHTPKESLVDFNRSGVPLVEIVSRPVIFSGQEAKLYLQRLQQTLRWLGVSDCDMEKGSMRLEANISVSRSESLPDYKVEIKNLNSFRFVQRAIDFEIKRQIKVLKTGRQPVQETRGFDLKKGITFSQRSKEVAKDYRYFPEPDLPPLKLGAKEIKRIKRQLPKLPWEREKELLALGVQSAWIPILCQKESEADFLFKTFKKGKSVSITPNQIAKELANNSSLRKKRPQQVIEEIKLRTEKFSLKAEKLEGIVKEVLKENFQAVADFRKGKTQAIGFLIGQVQRKTQGRADPKIATEKIAGQIKNNEG